MKENEVGFAHRFVRRAPHFLEQLGFAVTADSARVPDRERLIAALAERGNPIARNPRLIVHNRDVASGEPVEERGLADVRPARRSQPGG